MARNSTGNRGQRLPEDWQPSSDLLEWARNYRPDLADQLQDLTDSFKDFWLAEPNGRKLDWGRTWRNWIRRTPFRYRYGRANNSAGNGGVVL